MTSRGLRLFLCLIVAFAATDVAAYDLEPPTMQRPEQILGKRAKGPNYVVEGPVMGDGFLHNFKLRTEYGLEHIRGRRQLENRLKELAALHVLNGRSAVGSFGNGLANAVTSPFRFAGRLITSPAQTVGDTFSGVGEFFDRINSGINNSQHDRDGMLSSALGVSKGRRQLGYSLGVDPYTDFKPLAKRMSDLASASAVGEFAVAGALIFVPGAAGLAASGVTTASNVSTLVRDKTAAQLRDMNRKKLRKLGVDKKITERFLNNFLYSPSDHTAVVANISRLGHVRGLDAYVARLASAPNRDIAVFQRQRAEHLAIYDSKVGRLSEFVIVKGFPFNRTETGKIIGVFPLDEFAWTDPSAKLIQTVTDELRRRGHFREAEFRITGAITPLARLKLETYGWKPVGAVRY